MIYDIDSPDFAALLSFDRASELLTKLDALIEPQVEHLNATSCSSILNASYKYCLRSANNETQATTKLIELFNTIFAKQNVQLVRGQNEPEYFPANHNSSARIEFAHGFFASALHEISHWCVAGEARRQLSDFGYWYAPDGRSASQQQAFERVEIIPQAIECLFTLSCQRPFQVSQDNLFANFDTKSTFAYDVYKQAIAYIDEPHTLPRDAKIWLQALLTISIRD